MSAPKVERTHHETQGPAGSFVSQDNAQSTSRDPATNTTQKVTRAQTTYRTPDVHQLIPNKQQLSVILPIVLAIVLALILLSYRGAFTWHKEPKTWKDHVSEGVQNVKAGVQEGLYGYYEAAKDYVADASVKGQGYASEKMGETSEYLKNAANSAQEKTKSAAEMASEQAKVHGEYVKDKADALLHKGKTLSAEAQEELLHQKNIAAENARHYAAETKLRGREKLDSWKESADDLKRNVKSKVGL